MHTRAVMVALLILSVLGCSRPDQSERRLLSSLAGCWEVTHISPLNRPPSEWQFFSLASDSTLVQSLLFEVGPRSRVRTMDQQVAMREGKLIWEDYTGVLSESRDTIMATRKEGGWEGLFRLVRRRDADSVMVRLGQSDGGEYAYSAPETRDDGWKCAAMSSLGLRPGPILDLVRDIGRGRHDDIHSFLIVKDGHLVLEEYFAEDGSKRGPFITGLFRDRVHHLASTTKAVTSLLMGIAIDRGLIAGVEDPIEAYLPAYASLFNDAKKRIRVSHMLTMTAGFEWLQFGVSDEKNDGMRMWHSSDVIRMVLEKPLATEPGTAFNYTNGVPTVTGAIIKRATEMDAARFAEQSLFGPLGISRYLWTAYPDGSLETDGGLALRPRDLAKIGQLCLDGGRWKGEQIVSEAWVRESTRERLRFGKGLRWGYGYHWMQAESRIDEHPVRWYFVPGDGNQILAVFPEQKMVVVFTAGNYGRDPKPVYASIVEEAIFPAVIPHD